MDILGYFGLYLLKFEVLFFIGVGLLLYWYGIFFVWVNYRMVVLVVFVWGAGSLNFGIIVVYLDEYVFLFGFFGFLYWVNGRILCRWCGD